MVLIVYIGDILLIDIDEVSISITKAFPNLHFVMSDS